MTSLQSVLETYHMNVLKAMGRELGVAATRKADLIQTIGRIIKEGEHVERAVARLTPPERRALAVLQLAGGEAYTSALKSKLLKSGVVKPTPSRQPTWSGGGYGIWYEGNPNYKGQPSLEDLMARLARRGLVLSREPSRPDGKLIEWTPGHVVFIPESLRNLLPEFTPPEMITATSDLPQVLAGSSRSFQRDLGRYWRYIRSQNELRLTTQSYVYKADLKAINEMLSVPGDLSPGKGEDDNGRLYFIRRLLLDLRVVQGSHDSNLHPILETPFWGLSPIERVKRTFEAWRDGTGWNELLQLPINTRGYHHSNPAPATLKNVRASVLKHIRNMGADGWGNLYSLIDRIRLSDYGFLFPDRKGQAYSSSYSYYSYRYYGAYTTPYYEHNNPFGITFEGIQNESEGWEKVEADLIAHIVAGPLYWMGLVDLGYGQDAQLDPVNPSQPLAYRLTDMGAWVLGLGKAVEIAEEGGRIVVQPNFQILAMEPISDQVLITLDRFSEPEGGGDRVMTYRLTRESVYQGQRDGWEAPHIVEYLAKASGARLPDNVRRSLEEWQALHERIVFRRGVTVAQAADAETLDRLLEDHELAQALGCRITEDVTLPPGGVAETAGALRPSGWLPLITPNAPRWVNGRAEPSAPTGQREARDSLQADEEGRLHFVHAAPSIYVLGRVAHFTEDVDDGRQPRARQVTAPAVRRALRQGQTTVDDILTELRSVHVGDLPRRLVIDIKAWGRYYGDAQMDTLTLVEFQDQDTLHELLADPDLAPYLKPFEAGPRPLAAVDRQHLDTVQRLLAERGIEIRWGLE